MSFSDYLEEKVLSHVFTNTSYTAPTTVYVGLFTAAPSDTGGGTEISTSSTGYARQSAAFTVSGTSPTKAANSSAIDFPTATADWGSITHLAVFDAATGGNMLAFSAATTAKTINNGDILRIPAGSLEIRLD